MTKYKTRDGYSVELVQLAGTGNHDGQWLRVRYYGYFVADVRSVLELESYFPLADLEEALTARPEAKVDVLVPVPGSVGELQPDQPGDPVPGEHLLERIRQQVPGEDRCLTKLAV